NRADCDGRSVAAWREALADELDVAVPVELGVVRVPGGAIAEADLRPHVEVQLATAVTAPALERAALAPLVHEEGPCDLGPRRRARSGSRAAMRRHRGHARHGGDRDRQYRTAQRHRLPGLPPSRIRFP